MTGFMVSSDLLCLCPTSGRRFEKLRHQVPALQQGGRYDAMAGVLTSDDQQIDAIELFDQIQIDLHIEIISSRDRRYRSVSRTPLAIHSINSTASIAELSTGWMTP